MASIETRRSERTGLVSHRVRYRDAGSNKAETFESLKAAQAWAALVEQVGPAAARAALDGETPADGPPTVTEQVRRHVEHLTGVTDGTRRDYLTYLAKDIAPHIGDVPLPALTRDVVARWVNALADRGLSGKTIRNRHSLLSAALTAAQRERLIDVNPCKGMRLPRTDHQRAEMVMLSKAEFARLLEHVDAHWHPLLVTLVATGIRWGEATALTVADVDLHGRSARIRQAWKHTDGHGHELGPPKSRRSLRTVTLEPSICTVLAPLVEGRDGGAFVFTNRQGGPIRQNTFHGQVWQPAVRGFAGDTKHLERPAGGRGRSRVVWTPGPGKRPRVHDLRHTYASWALAAGVPLPVIQRSMGHESITTTVDTYGHLQRADFEVLARATTPLLGLD